MLFSFFFNNSATTAIYTLSLHDALPISDTCPVFEKLSIRRPDDPAAGAGLPHNTSSFLQDRKSTRLNSSHVEISYAVFCLKKKMKKSPTKLIFIRSEIFQG